MKSKTLDFFSYSFSKLHRDMKNGGAPHKPILLLAIIHEYELGRIHNNQIFITPELTHSFSTYWNQLVKTKNDARFALPFFHLKGEKGNWWKLIPNAGCELWIENAGSMRSFSNLSTAVAYAEIDINLSNLLLLDETRQVLKEIILKTYFNENKLQSIENQEDKYLLALKNELYESTNEYKSTLRKLKSKLDIETYQIEVYNRSNIFRREIIKIYDETCSMSGLKVKGTFSISMVDACHIEQFAKTFNNHPTNGIALCPNLHRAFDRGAIAINDNYEIILSKSLKENLKSEYSLHKLENRKIILPQNKLLFPSLESLAWHRKNVFNK